MIQEKLLISVVSCFVGAASVGFMYLNYRALPTIKKTDWLLYLLSAVWLLFFSAWLLKVAV